MASSVVGPLVSWPAEPFGPSVAVTDPSVV